MTLPDFIEFEPFNRLRRLMNAALPDEFSTGYTINRLTQDDLDRALEGIEGVTVDDISDAKFYPTEHWPIKIGASFCISAIDRPLVDTILSTTCQNFISRIAELSKK